MLIVNKFKNHFVQKFTRKSYYENYRCVSFSFSLFSLIFHPSLFTSLCLFLDLSLLLHQSLHIPVSDSSSLSLECTVCCVCCGWAVRVVVVVVAVDVFVCAFLLVL